MRSLSVVVGSYCAWLFAAAAAVAADEGQFPYTAYANSDDVYIRSGPGKNYYPADKLPRGEPVEVYRHDPGGWYAIRPPRGSFSWVPARLLQPTTGHLATVNGDRVVSRVGSRFSDVRDVIQVRFDRGEEVEILEVKTLNTSGQPEQWCKIAPPSGEFRWVFGKFVDDQPPTSSRPTTSQHSRTVAYTDRGAADHDDTADHDPPADYPIRTASVRQPRRNYDGDGELADAADDEASVRQTGGINRNPRSGEDASGSARSSTKTDSPPASAAAISFQAEIDSIDLALSSMVVEEPTVWKFDDLDRRAEKALDRAQTAVERGRARLLLDRIAKFEDIKRRLDTVDQVQGATDRKNNLLVNVADARQPGGLAEVEGTERFDAAGRLINVVSQRPGAPPYAIVNADRVVIAFVTPSPGVNLRPFIGKQVGVTGQRGFIPEMSKPHVTAQRIVPLDQSATTAIAAGRTAPRR